MTYFDLNWLLFSKPGTNLFLVGVNDRHIWVLANNVYDNLMLPILRARQRFISLRNDSTITFVLAGDLDEKTRGISNVKVVFGDDLKDDDLSR